MCMKTLKNKIERGNTLTSNCYIEDEQIYQPPNNIFAFPNS
jgi:hypothetical protein